MLKSARAEFTLDHRMDPVDLADPAALVAQAGDPDTDPVTALNMVPVAPVGALHMVPVALDGALHTDLVAPDGGMVPGTALVGAPVMDPDGALGMGLEMAPAGEIPRPLLRPHRLRAAESAREISPATSAMGAKLISSSMAAAIM